MDEALRHLSRDKGGLMLNVYLAGPEASERKYSVITALGALAKLRGGVQHECG